MKTKDSGFRCLISLHVCVGHVWNFGTVDSDDAISCPMCLACLKTKDSGCRWCDTLTFICAFPGPRQSRTFIFPSNLAHSSPRCPSRTYPRRTSFQGYSDYLICLHLCVCLVRKVGTVGSDHATCLELFVSHVCKPRILDSCDLISSYLFSLYLFVGGSGWVYTGPLYSFQETLVLLLLLLATTPPYG